MSEYGDQLDNQMKCLLNDISKKISKKVDSLIAETETEKNLIERLRRRCPKPYTGDGMAGDTMDTIFHLEEITSTDLDPMQGSRFTKNWLKNSSIIADYRELFTVKNGIPITLYTLRGNTWYHVGISIYRLGVSSDDVSRAMGLYKTIERNCRLERQGLSGEHLGPVTRWSRFKDWLVFDGLV